MIGHQEYSSILQNGRKYLGSFLMAASLIPFYMKGIWVPFSLAQRGVDSSFGIGATIELNWFLTALACILSLIFFSLSRYCLRRWNRTVLIILTSGAVLLVVQDIGLHVVAELVRASRS